MITPFCKTCDDRERQKYGRYQSLPEYRFCQECGAELPIRPPAPPPPPDQCPSCGGIGWQSECDDSYACWKWTCETCDGTGKVQEAT